MPPFRRGSDVSGLNIRRGSKFSRSLKALKTAINPRTGLFKHIRVIRQVRDAKGAGAKTRALWDNTQHYFNKFNKLGDKADQWLADKGEKYKIRSLTNIVRYPVAEGFGMVKTVGTIAIDGVNDVVDNVGRAKRLKKSLSR